MTQRRASRGGHNLIWQTFITLRGNQRACLWTEPLWGIPYYLFTPLAAVYMAALGLSPFDIGIVTAVSLLSQTFAAFISGVVTDKLGRRTTTWMADMVCWVLAPILWATAQGMGSFLLAAALNGLWRVSETSWGLLLTEDAEPDKLIHLYAITNIAGLVAGFVSPLTFLFVREYSLVTTMRGLYAFMALMMVIKAFLLNRMATETAVGARRKAENRGVPLLKNLRGGGAVLRHMLHSRRIMLTIALVTCYMMIRSINDNFWPLMITEKLGLADESLSLLSTLRTLVMLLCYVVIVPRLDVRAFKRPFIAAMMALMVVNLVLFFLREGAYAVIITGVMVEAAALSTLTPLLSTLNMRAMDKEQRARMLSFATTMALLVASPFGAVFGWLSRVDRALPMLINIALAALSIRAAMALHTALEQEGLL